MGDVLISCFGQMFRYQQSLGTCFLKKITKFGHLSQLCSVITQYVGQWMCSEILPFIGFSIEKKIMGQVWSKKIR